MRALVLSGGGSKGSYQIGVWKALRDMDIKFGMSTNDQLSDQILVSIIASHFTSDIIFTAPAKDAFVINKKPIINTNTEDKKEETKEQSNSEDDIIPSFLEGKFF